MMHNWQTDSMVQNYSFAQCACGGQTAQTCATAVYANNALVPSLKSKFGTSPASLFQRWGQPGQQQGRRIPSLSSVRTRSMCCLLVSGFLTEITQQIHSLRASGVISSHFARATGSEMRTFRKSGGTLCTAPGEITFLVMNFILLRYAIGLGVLGCFVMR